jgi:hypothetical protein
MGIAPSVGVHALDVNHTPLRATAEGDPRWASRRLGDSLLGYSNRYTVLRRGRSLRLDDGLEGDGGDEGTD